MKPIISVLLCLLLCLSPLVPVCGEEAAEELPPVNAFPEPLRFTQTVTEREYHHESAYSIRTYPDTFSDTVDTEMRDVIDEMHARALPFLPLRYTENMPSYLDTGAVISRTGTKWMSFLTISRIACEREQIYVDFDARTYDMQSGVRLTLCDVFEEDSGVWEYLAQEVRGQLSLWWDGEEPDAETLDSLCTEDALKAAPFVMGAGKLSLIYRADTLYQSTTTLMRVSIYYPDVASFMTAEAKEQTDNSAYTLVALTFDDGPARSYTTTVTDQLRLHGANATFFIVGSRIRTNHDVVSLESDAGYTVASHNYEHTYKGLTPENIAAWRKQFDREINALVGTKPTMMRAPGGYYNQFINAKVGYPLIQWSVSPGDPGTGKEKIHNNAWTVIGMARNGSVVLLHDINPNCYAYTEMILDEFEHLGILCVSVDELFSMNGVTLEENTMYTSCEEPVPEQ